MEYREGKGLVLFCQTDVTGRTEADPAAEILVRNLLRYASAWKPSPRRTAVYVGDPAGQSHLDAIGVSADSFDSSKLSGSQVLVVGHGAGPMLAAATNAIADWLKTGGHLLAIGLDQEEARALLPFPITMRKAEHIAAYFDPPAMTSPFASVSPADVHNRDPRELPLVSSGAQVIGDGVLAVADQANVVFCQLEPWQFSEPKQANLRRTHRRTSFLLSRLLANLGVAADPPLLDRFRRPANDVQAENRWLTGFYLDQPEEWDDPYRFFRW